MAKQKIKSVIENPEALEVASIRKTKVIFDMWWESEMKTQQIILCPDQEKIEIENPEV